MSEQLLGVIIGGAIGLLGSLIGIVVNHWLEIRREERRLKIEAERELRGRLTEGLPTRYSEIIDAQRYAVINRCLQILHEFVTRFEAEIAIMQKVAEERKAIAETQDQAELPEPSNHDAQR